MTERNDTARCAGGRTAFAEFSEGSRAEEKKRAIKYLTRVIYNILEKICADIHLRMGLFHVDYTV